MKHCRSLTVLLFVAFTGLSLAQSLSVTVTPTTAHPGDTATVTVSFVDSAPSSAVAGFSGSLTVNGTAYTLPSCVQSTLMTTEQKVCSISGANFLVIGSGGGTASWLDNFTSMASGIMLTVPITVPAATGPTSLPITISGAAGASTSGAPVALSVVPTTLAVACSLYAVTGDCTSSQADVNAMVSAALGKTACTGLLALVGSGKCAVTDVMLTILSVLGQIP